MVNDFFRSTQSQNNNNLLYFLIQQICFKFMHNLSLSASKLFTDIIFFIFTSTNFKTAFWLLLLLLMTGSNAFLHSSFLVLILNFHFHFSFPILGGDGKSERYFSVCFCHYLSQNKFDSMTSFRDG